MTIQKVTCAKMKNSLYIAYEWKCNIKCLRCCGYWKYIIVYEFI